MIVEGHALVFDR